MRTPRLASFRALLARYRRIHAPLLAKGLSFSFVVAGAPLIFFLVAIGSFVVQANLVAVIESELLGFMPEEVRLDLIETIAVYASRPGSISFVSIVVFLFVVNTFFFDLYRAASVAIGTTYTMRGGRLWAMVYSTLFVLLIYLSALLTLTARVVGANLSVPPVGTAIGARLVATAIVAVVFWGVLRIAAGERLPRGSFGVSLLGAAGWQLVLGAGAYLVGMTAARFVMYGILTWAVIYLVYMRILSEIIIWCALWVSILREPPPRTDRY